MSFPSCLGRKLPAGLAADAVMGVAALYWPDGFMAESISQLLFSSFFVEIKKKCPSMREGGNMSNEGLLLNLQPQSLNPAWFYCHLQRNKGELVK